MLCRHNVALHRLELIDCLFTEAVRGWSEALIQNKQSAITALSFHSRKQNARKAEVAASISAVLGDWR